MKLFRHIFAFIVVVSLASCTSDDPPAYQLNTENLSAGTYEVTYLASNNTETININGLDIITEASSIGETFQLTVDFFCWFSSGKGWFGCGLQFINNGSLR